MAEIPVVGEFFWAGMECPRVRSIESLHVIRQPLAVPPRLAELAPLPLHETILIVEDRRQSRRNLLAYYADSLAAESWDTLHPRVDRSSGAV